VSTRHRQLPASEPDAEPACRLTPEEGRRRQADTDRLFASLREQRHAGQARNSSLQAIPMNFGNCCPSS